MQISLPKELNNFKFDQIYKKNYQHLYCSMICLSNFANLDGTELLVEQSETLHYVNNVSEFKVLLNENKQHIVE